MQNITRIKSRIKAYKETVGYLKRKIKKMEKRIEEATAENESVEEGEIVDTKKKDRKRKSAEEKENFLLPDAASIEEMAQGNLSEVFKIFFDTIDKADVGEQQVFLKALLPFLSNTHKYVLLHDIVLLARELEKYEVFYTTLFPGGFEKDRSEVGEALSAIYRYLRGDETKESLKKKAVHLLACSGSLSVIGKNEIFQDAFDAATAIKLYSKTLDWKWTYNEFIREHLFPELKKTDHPFPVYVLSLLYAEWHRTLVLHKSLEYLIQILDKIAGIGHGENIISSPYCLESQLASSLMLRQFRPGATLKWHRKRIEEVSSAEKEVIDSAWKIDLF